MELTKGFCFWILEPLDSQNGGQAQRAATWVPPNAQWGFSFWAAVLCAAGKTRG